MYVSALEGGLGGALGVDGGWLPLPTRVTCRLQIRIPGVKIGLVIRALIPGFLHDPNYSYYYLFFMQSVYKESCYNALQCDDVCVTTSPDLQLP